MRSGRNRRGSMLPALLGLMFVAAYAGLEAGTCWSAVLERDRQEELAARLIRLQRAVDEAGERLQRPPRDLTEVAALSPPVLSRVPLDPFTGSASWRLVVGPDAGVRVRSSSTAQAFDGTSVGSWEARPVGYTWRISKEAR